MRAVVYCAECHEPHPVIAGRPACPQPPKRPNPDRPRCGVIIVDLDLNPTAARWR